MRARETAAQHGFFCRTACGLETLHSLCSCHGQPSAAPTKEQQQEKGPFTHSRSRRSDGAEGSADVVGYAER